MQKIKTLVLFILIALLFWGCTKKIVGNSLNPEVDEIVLISQGKIDLSQQLETIDLWGIYPKGIILISLSEKFIKAIDFEGNLIKELFKEGEGPEEFLVPTPLFIHKDRGEIEIYDSSLFRSTFYDFDLNFLRTETSGYDFCTIKKDLGDGEFQLNHSFTNTEGNLVYTFKAQIVYPDTTKKVKKIDMDYSRYDYSGNLFAACSNDKIYLSLSTSDKFEIKIYDHKGNFLETFTKDHQPISINRENKEERLKFKEESGIAIQNWEYQPAVVLMQPDYQGNLWVKTMNGVDNYIWYIFDKNGKIFAKYSTETPRNFIKSFDNRIYQLTGNEDDGYQIEFFTIGQ